jgi:glucokinase
VNNAVRITNLGNVVVDGYAIEQDVSDEFLRRITVCQVINDFVAQGYGCLTLTESDVKHLYGPDTGIIIGGGTTTAASKLPPGPKVCVGAGTGLGECYLTPDSSTGQYSCFASEGGHVEYTPRDDLEIGLWKYLLEKFQSKHRVSVERVVSGIGLANVYEYLAKIFPGRVDPKIQANFEKAGDEQGRVVGENAKAGDPLCREAMDVMMAAYGREVGSAAIKWIPSSGLYVTGGLTPKNLPFIEGQDSQFMRSYLDKGRVSPVLDKIPLYAVLTEDLGVRGAHKAATLLYEKRRGGLYNHDHGSIADDKSALDTPSSSPLLLQRDVLLLGATIVFGFATGLWIGATRR